MPWQLASSDRAARRPERAQPGAARRGLDDRAFTAADETPAAAGARGDPVDRGHAGTATGARPAGATATARRPAPAPTRPAPVTAAGGVR